MTSHRPHPKASEPQMEVAAFEDAAAAAGRHGVRMEFLYGRLGVKALPDGDHLAIISWITRECLRLRPDLWFFTECGLKVESYRKGRARADGVLAPEGSSEGQGEWLDPGKALMVVEVTSYDTDTDQRDRQEKPKAYAEAGIPIYLLVDRDAGQTVVFSSPEEGTYTKSTVHFFGQDVKLPAPVSMVLETERFRGWVR